MQACIQCTRTALLGWSPCTRASAHLLLTGCLSYKCCYCTCTGCPKNESNYPRAGTLCTEGSLMHSHAPSHELQLLGADSSPVKRFGISGYTTFSSSCLCAQSSILSNMGSLGSCSCTKKWQS